MQILLTLPGNLATCFHDLTGKDPAIWLAVSDPREGRIGSGGGTAHLLARHKGARRMNDAALDHYLASDKKIVIHAGGRGRRLPAYAPSGKLLTPIPVFRWSRGQSLNQTLLDLQMPLLERIMQATGPEQNTLIAAGDVLIHSSDRPLELPRADVVCLGLWVDPHLASRHGVFFAARDHPQQLDFMLQKPDHAVIERLATTHLFLMDIGIWVLSDRAVQLLMEKCGWTGAGFARQIPRFYDLYSDFGTCLGAHPSQRDRDIAALSAVIVPMDQGEFYHYGTSRELIQSTEKIQNRVQDQRNIWHHRVKPHPSIFVQNTLADIRWNSQHHHVWIENSHVPSTWELHHDHVITGIPDNDWSLVLHPGLCLDIIPIGEDHYCIRPYGMEDTFSGTPGPEQARWMGRPVSQWLTERGISAPDAGLHDALDIQAARLFPVVERSELTGAFIQWMLGPGDAGDHKTRWLSARRLSADEICDQAHLPRLIGQRTSWRRRNLLALAANHSRSVFYQADLKQAAQEYAAAGHPLPPPLPPSLQPMIRSRDHMFRSEVLRHSGLDGAREESLAFHVLQAAIRQTVSGKSSPIPNTYPDQIVWGRSPARLDLAGGWSDTPPYCLQAGGTVLNVAVELNGQPPIQVFLRRCQDNRITLRSIDNGVSEDIHTFQQLETLHLVGSAFSIPKAALCLAGFHPDFCATAHDSLAEQLRAFGGGFEMSLLAAIPKGSGLGTSSILAATVLGALSDFCSLNWDPHAVCHRTLVLEQLLTTGGGWQDQYGGVFPGVKLLESEPGTQERINVRWLPDRLFTRPEYKDAWLLYYTGITRVAKSILADIVRGMFLNEGRRLRIVDDIKRHAYRLADALERCDFTQAGRLVGHSWKLNNELDSGTTTPQVQRIIDLVADYACGFKLLGAGGGGYMVICAKDPQAASRIHAALTQNPPNASARFVNMDISQTGFQVSRS